MDAISKDLLNPSALVGSVMLGAMFFVAATLAAVVVRKSARRIEHHLTDVTALRFISAFAQALVYLIGFVLYARGGFARLHATAGR